MPTLKVKNNGVWERVAGGGSSSISDRLIVTIDAVTMTASHSASEIMDAVKSGRAVCAVVPDYNFIYNQFDPTSTSEYVRLRCISNVDDDIAVSRISIPNDGVVTFDILKVYGIPSGGTAGQVLTIGEDGTHVWADPIDAVNIPSSEEAVF